MRLRACKGESFNMKSALRLIIPAAALFVGVAGAEAVTFDNVVITAPPLSTGATYAAIGNTISFFTPSALVGDPVAPLRSGLLSIQYDAHIGADPGAFSSITNDTVGVVLGSGQIDFSEDIFEIDGLGNEIGGPIGHIGGSYTVASSTPWDETGSFSRAAKNIRAKKVYLLSAVDTHALDLAAIGIINQHFESVPEPASFAVLGLGIVAVLKRRKK